MIDYEQLYKDTISIIKSASNGLWASPNFTIDINKLIDKIYEGLKALAIKIEKDSNQNCPNQLTNKSEEFFD